MNEQAPLIGSDYPVPELGAEAHGGHTFVVIDNCSKGVWRGAEVTYPGIGASAPKQLADTVWATRYAALYYFNRSPWVERGIVGSISDVKLLAPGDPIPDGAWVIELLDECDDPGALGYHEGQAHTSKAGKAGAHSKRGVAASNTETVVCKIGVQTSRRDGVPATEVVTHELFEAAVDPYVNAEDEIRTYTNPDTGREYIAEVGDPVQDRAWDIGAPEGRKTGVPEGLISDYAWPSWWGQEQTRTATSQAEDAKLADRVEPWVLAEGGYMSIRDPGGEWEQEYGSDKARAKANADAYEGGEKDRGKSDLDESAGKPSRKSPS